jgi:hypothetical protein
MYNRLFFSLGACVLSVGLVHAQPIPYSPPSDGRVAPRTLMAPAPARDPALFRIEPSDKVNKIPEASSNRLFSPQDSARSAVPPLPENPVRKVSGEPLSRSYSPPSDGRVAPRTLMAPAPARDPALFRIEPGDKVNKIPEASSNRLFSPQDSARSAVPPLPEVPVRNR